MIPLSTLLVAASLLLAALTAWGATRMRGATAVATWVRLAGSWGVAGLMFLAFLSVRDASDKAVAPWLITMLSLVTAVLAALFVEFWTQGLVPLVARRGRIDIGAMTGTGIVLGALHALGLYMYLRLIVIRDPNVGFGDLAGGLSVYSFVRFAAPTIVLMVFVLILAAVEYTRIGVPWGAPARRWQVRAAQLGDEVRESRFAFRIDGRVRAWKAVPLPARRLQLLLVFGALVAICYGLPLLGSSEADGTRLAFHGLRLPEIGKYLLFIGIAVLAAGDRRTPRRGRLSLSMRADGLDGMLPMLLLGGALALSGLRGDLGCVVAAVAGYVAVRLTAYARLNAEISSRLGIAPSVASHPVWRYSGRWVSVAALMILVVLAGAWLTGKQSRFESWADPFQYRWQPQCVAVEDPTNPIRVQDSELPVLPDGVEACTVARSSDRDSYRSQSARGLVSIEGGGFWGRGITDTHSRLVGSTARNDLVISQVWSKLGGVNVLLCLMLLCLLGELVRRTIPVPGGWRQLPERNRVAFLYASAVSAGIVAQGIYIAAANVNLVPLSGVPFPMVADGMFASTATVLGLAVIAVLPVAAVTPEPASGQPARAAVVFPATAASVLASVLVVYWGLAFPMAALHSGAGWFSLDRGWSTPDVRTFAASPESRSLQVGGEAAFDWRAGWRPVAGRSVDLGEISEFVTEQGNGYGLADGTADSGTSVARSFLDRLRGVDLATTVLHGLTVDATLQDVAREAAAEPVDGVRLATGVAILDPTTGKVLAMASTPGPTDGMPARNRVEEDPEKLAAQVKALNDGERGYRSGIGTEDYRLEYQVDPYAAASWQGPYLSSYGYVQPVSASLQQNRAGQREYGPGSVFKLVIATAHLDGGGSIDDQLPSPSHLIRNGRTVDNVYNGFCPGVVDGKMSLAAAIAVSCNTTFVLLAEKLGWPAVLDAARSLGLEVGGDVPECVGEARSFVPSTTKEGLENLALGGGSIGWTPLTAATVVGTIANDGVAEAPRVLDGPDDPPGCGRRAIKPAIAAQLRTALAQAGRSGTLMGVIPPGGPQLYGKSGTQVLDVPPGPNAVDHDHWVVGFVDTAKGPIAFAIVVEGHGPELSRTHARTIAGQLAARITDEYGRA